jgi:hypothetical protein
MHLAHWLHYAGYVGEVEENPSVQMMIPAVTQPQVEVVEHVVWNPSLLETNENYGSRQFLSANCMMNRCPAIKESLHEIAEPRTDEDPPVPETVVNPMVVVQEVRQLNE